jgi:3-oxoadipate enol-lactonase
MKGEKEALRDCIKGTSNQAISGHYFSQVLRFDYSKQVSSIHVPTLVIAGGRDELTPPVCARYIYDRVEDSEYHELEQGGHYIPLHNHGYFNQMLLDFIKSRLYVDTRRLVD